MSNIPTTAFSNGDLLSKVQLIIHALLLLVGATAVLFIIIGGFQYIVAAGHKESVDRAKRTIFYSIFGLIIALLAQPLVAFIFQQLRIQ